MKELIPTLWLLTFFFFSGADKLNFSFMLFKGKLSNIIALAGFGGICVALRAFYLHWSLILTSFLIFLSTIASSFFSPLFKRSIGYSVVFLIEFFLYFLIAYQVIFLLRERKVLGIYKNSFLLVGTYAFLQLFLSLFGIMDPLVGQFIGRLARPHAFMYEPSYYALFLASYVFFFSAYTLFKAAPTTRGDRNILLLSHFFFLLSTSTGAFMAYFFLLPCMFIVKIIFIHDKVGPQFYSRLWNGTKEFLALMTLAFILVSDIFFRYFFKFFNPQFVQHGSFSERWDGIFRALKGFTANPFFGKGVGGIGAYLYFKAEELPEQSPVTLSEIEPFDPTNVTSEILGSLGLFGAFAIGLLVVLVFVSLWKVSRIGDEFEEERAVAVSLLMSWILVMVMYQFSQGLFRNYIWIHTGIVFGYTHKLLIRAGVIGGSSRSKRLSQWRRSLPSLSSMGMQR